MDLFFNILIVIFTAILTTIPFFGDLWVKKKKGYKFYKKGIAFLIIAGLGIILSTILIIRETNDQDLRDKTQTNTFDNTEKIISGIRVSTSEMETKLARIDSLNIKLDSINSKTINSIKKRDNILDGFNHLNSKLEKLYEQETLKINENVPSINILDKVVWEKEENVYKISLTFSNTGKRAAVKFRFKAYLFYHNYEKNVLEYQDLSEEIPGDSEIPVEKKLRFRLPINNQKLDSINKLKKSYLIISYKYSDFINNKEFQKIEKFFWRNQEKDDLNWRYMNKTLSDLIDKYMNENNIKI